MAPSLSGAACVSHRRADWEAIPLHLAHPNRSRHALALSCGAGSRAISPRAVLPGTYSCEHLHSCETPCRYDRRSSSPLDITPRRDNRARLIRRCCSSVVERTLGKGEVGSSILPSSTMLAKGENEPLVSRRRLRADVLGANPPYRYATFGAPANPASALAAALPLSRTKADIRLASPERMFNRRVTMMPISTLLHVCLREAQKTLPCLQSSVLRAANERTCF